MKITIEISEDRIIELAERMIAEEIVNDYTNNARWGENYDIRKGVTNGISRAVKLIVEDKGVDKLTETAVEKASEKIAKKGLKELINKAVES